MVLVFFVQEKEINKESCCKKDCCGTKKKDSSNSKEIYQD